MVKIQLFGAAKEVGRSCAFVRQKDKAVFFDAGLKIFDEPEDDDKSFYDIHGRKISSKKKRDKSEKYPMQHNLDADALFLSHAHLDHSGAMPLYHSMGAPYRVFCTQTTALLAELLVRDSYKIDMINKEKPAYKKSDITSAFENIKRVSNGKPGVHNGIKFFFHHAGHIPGSSSVSVSMNGKKIIYTGDLKFENTRLMKGASYDFESPDVMIMESTYGDREHPDREEQENDFVMNIKKTINDGGSVIIPTFAVGRMQEILLILSRHDFDVPIYLDGMGKKVTELVLSNPHTIKNADLLRKKYADAKKIGYMKQRKQIFNRQGIILTTSGMLSGGPIMDYLKNMNKPSNTMLLTGYQAEGTNGRMLLDDGNVLIDKRKQRVACKYKKYDFSAHAGKKELQNMVKKANPKCLVLNHGDSNSMDSFSEWARKEGFKVFCPETGEQINLN